MKKVKLIYNGATFCADCDECPIVELDPLTQTVRIHDPAKPQNGSYTMTIAEYNTLLKNAPLI